MKVEGRAETIIKIAKNTLKGSKKMKLKLFLVGLITKSKEIKLLKTIYNNRIKAAKYLLKNKHLLKNYIRFSYTYTYGELPPYKKTAFSDEEKNQLQEIATNILNNMPKKPYKQAEYRTEFYNRLQKEYKDIKRAKDSGYWINISFLIDKSWRERCTQN